MEQIKAETKNMPKGKQTRTVAVWIEAALLALLAAGVWFGLHPYYRPAAAALLCAAALALIKPGWAWWLSAGAMLGVVAALWSFGPSGYRFASAVPALCAAMIVLFRFGKRPVKIAASVLVGLLAAVLLAAEAPIAVSALSEPAPGAPYVVVLGAAVYGETPSLSLENRVKRAIEYLEANPNAKVVVSGGQGEGENISEAECMRRYLEAHGIEADRILMEDHSTSTMENLTFSKAVIERDGGSAEKIVIVSSGYHLYRAKEMASSLGMDADGAASDDGYPVFMCGMYLREALAVGKLRLFGSWERSACLASAYARAR